MNIEFQNGYLLGLASGGIVEVKDSTEMDALGNFIDQSGVLEDTEGTVTEKVKELIEKAKSGSSPSIDENGIVTFGENTNIDENGIMSL